MTENVERSNLRKDYSTPPSQKIEESPLPRSSGGPAPAKMEQMLKGAGKVDGVPVAILGKLMGGAALGSGLPVGAAGMIGAGMGLIASGALGGNKFEGKGELGLLLTQINIPIKFIGNFGSGLTPKGSEPEIYKKLEDSYKTLIKQTFKT